jgi:hypothetical protein
MANEDKPQEDDLVAKLVPDPSQGPPDATVLTGYLGRAPEATGKGKEASWRLYQSAALDEYVEIAEVDILHTQKLPDDRGTMVWVPKSLPLQYVHVHSEQVQAELLGGAIARRSLTATPAHIESGRVRPSLGIACSITTCHPDTYLSWTPCPSVACHPDVNVSQTPCPSVACVSFTSPCATQAGRCESSAPSQCTLCPTPSATPSHCTLCPPPSATPSHCTLCPPPRSAVSGCFICPTPSTHCPSHTVVCLTSVAVSHCGLCPTPVTSPVSATGCPTGPVTFGCPFGGAGGENED